MSGPRRVVLSCGAEVFVEQHSIQSRLRIVTTARTGGLRIGSLEEIFEDRHGWVVRHRYDDKEDIIWRDFQTVAFSLRSDACEALWRAHIAQKAKPKIVSFNEVEMRVLRRIWNGELTCPRMSEGGDYCYQNLEPMTKEEADAFTAKLEI